MLKAILNSKWYWYIPIISLIFIKQMGYWSFKADTNLDCGYRSILVTYTMILIHVPAILILLIKTAIF